MAPVAFGCTEQAPEGALLVPHQPVGSPRRPGEGPGEKLCCERVEQSQVPSFGYFLWSNVSKWMTLLFLVVDFRPTT